MHEGEVSARLGLAGIPSISESTLIARDAAIARYEDGRIHIQHLSARESVEAIAEAKARGVQITCEASPHHLTLTDEALLEKLDTRLKMNPPLRSEDDRQALIDGLRTARSTASPPTTRRTRARRRRCRSRRRRWARPAWRPRSPRSTPSSSAGVLPLALIVQKLTAGAALMDLPTPEIAVGAPADLVLIDLDAEWEVGEAGYESRSENCCFAGRTPAGPRLTTIAAGGIVYRERVLAAAVSAYVLLEDGTRFDGDAVGAPARSTGEVVFTTGMSGYQESMTDPSFARQLITFTTAHVGNYGVSEAAMESDRIHAAGAIMRAAVDYDDAPGAEQGWLSWLRENGIPGIAGVDTRALVRHIRSAGAMRGGIFAADVPVNEARERDRRRAEHGRPRPRPRGDDRRAARSTQARATARGSSRWTPASSARSSATSPRAARRSRSTRARRPPRNCWRATRTASSSSPAPATRPRWTTSSRTSARC